MKQGIESKGRTGVKVVAVLCPGNSFYMIFWEICYPCFLFGRIDTNGSYLSIRAMYLLKGVFGKAIGVFNRS